jgi:hypothetical protein
VIFSTQDRALNSQHPEISREIKKIVEGLWMEFVDEAAKSP